MVIQYLTCPLCGFEFNKHDTLCNHGCPLGSMCQLMRCPSCNYEFPETRSNVSWLKRLFGKREQAVEQVAVEVPSLKDLRSGDRARVLCIGRTRERGNSLAVFGLVTDCEITLIQHYPAYVIRVDETEVAIDEAIAREIMVQPLGPASRSCDPSVDIAAAS